MTQATTILYPFKDESRCGNKLRVQEHFSFIWRTQHYCVVSLCRWFLLLCWKDNHGGSYSVTKQWKGNDNIFWAQIMVSTTCGCNGWITNPNYWTRWIPHKVFVCHSSCRPWKKKRLFCVLVSKSLSLPLRQRSASLDPATYRWSVLFLLRRLEPLLLFWSFPWSLHFSSFFWHCFPVWTVLSYLTCKRFISTFFHCGLLFPIPAISPGASIIWFLL